MCWLILRCASAFMIDYTQKGRVEGHVTCLNLGKYLVSAFE